ncbi:hypothetical protein DPMN_036107 [Dreissena polymorpha]|uniref:Uncharacterized protein n=1 Tax=Dreissena polymorpha TaxID=45954 RepID=A0A9D4MAU5_DREPO|nr:hypothetical protein DPMN_036107 [Dreissena polymorpha]
MDSAKLSKNTHLGISRDYPREISEARKDLWPDFKAARDKYGSKNLKMLFPTVSARLGLSGTCSPIGKVYCAVSETRMLPPALINASRKSLQIMPSVLTLNNRDKARCLQRNPNLCKRYNQPQTMMNRTQLSRNRKNRQSHPPNCHRNSPDT